MHGRAQQSYNSNNNRLFLGPIWSRCRSMNRDVSLPCILESQFGNPFFQGGAMIRKLKSGEYRLYSRKINPKTGKRRNLGTFSTLAKAKQHEKAVQYFKRAG